MLRPLRVVSYQVQWLILSIAHGMFVRSMHQSILGIWLIKSKDVRDNSNRWEGSMLNIELFVDTLKHSGVSFFTGVPDSFLNGFCNCLIKKVDGNKHVIAANEGNAIAIAAGYYLSTESIPLVYMQNSGIGNAVNPLLSLVEKHVYSIPLILLIGWRGQPATGDHEQHYMQGQLTLPLLESMEIPYLVIEDDDSTIPSLISWGIETAKCNQCPVAFVAPKGTLSGEKGAIADFAYPMNREDAMRVILDCIPDDAIYVATTGRATRELYYLREERRQSHKHDFLNVGAMGHSSSIATGIALANREKTVVCLDGDAAAVMHLGALTTISKIDVPNLVHIVLNNGAHESVGGQPSVGHVIDLTCIARGCGYNTLNQPVTKASELTYALKQLIGGDRPVFIEVRIGKGMKRNLPALNISPIELKRAFMQEVRSQ
jgi:phosphonopyruvate decarboxylase